MFKLPETSELRLGVFVVLKNEKDEILLLHRTDWDMWCLPGGFVEFGESVVEGAKRECLEEIGVQIEVKGLLGIYSDPGRHVFRFSNGASTHYVTLVFLSSIVAGDPLSLSSESRAVGYFGRESLPRLTPSHQVWIEDAFTSPTHPYIR
jgi:ADP-ribose pyrophosphatase YjhB (NUDIX family)